jgi:hypothetical protein
MEIKGLALYLASDATGFMTGTAILIDGDRRAQQFDDLDHPRQARFFQIGDAGAVRDLGLKGQRHVRRLRAGASGLVWAFEVRPLVALPPNKQ